MIKKLITLSLITSTALLAVNIPNAGDILRKVEPAKIPAIKKTLPSIEQEFKAPMEIKDDFKIMINSFTFSGNTVYSSEFLASLIKEYNQKELGINGLKTVASIITKYYRDHGYFVARAYIPKQSMENGIVEIAIIEGTYGNFEVKNDSLVDTNIVQNYMNQLQGGERVSSKTLERQMLLINDLSGATVTNAEVYPGEAIGTSDFRITASPTPKYTGYAIVDNYGSRYTGEGRLGAGAIINSISGVGDSLAITGLLSNTANLKNARVAYERTLGYTGLRGGINSSITQYNLDKIDNYEGFGTMQSIGLNLSYPLIKTRAHTLSTNLTYDHKNMKDESGLIGTTDESLKKIDTMTLSLNDAQSTTMANLPGSLQSSIGITAGNLTLGNNVAKDIDRDLKTEGSYAKLNLNLSHNQFLVQNLTLLSSLKAQKSLGKNLDFSEDLSVTGSNGVRAYEDSELNGDQGYFASLELNYALPKLEAYSHSTSFFVDHAKMWRNDSHNFNTEKNTRILNAVGLGYTLNYKLFDLKATYAYGFGGEATPTTEAEFSTNKSKFLVQGMMRF